MFTLAGRGHRQRRCMGMRLTDVAHVELMAHIALTVGFANENLLRLLADHVSEGLPLLPIDVLKLLLLLWRELE